MIIKKGYTLEINKFAVILLPLLLSLCILQICFPGFMSYDSIQMLEEARSNVNGGIFPAAPVYILRLFDLSGHGPTVMVQMQNFILLLSVTLILRMLGASFIATAISLLTLLAMPTVIGCMLVLWKDVTLVALVVLSLSMMFWASQKNKEKVFYQIAKWASLLLLIIGTLVKFNAITSTVIIAIYWLSVFFKNRNLRVKCLAFFLIISSMIVSNKLINGYSFPDFKKLQPNNIVYGLMANDLIGISKWSRESLIPFDVNNTALSAKIPISDIDAIYTSLGSAVMHENNMRLGGVVNIFPVNYKQQDITAAWIAAVIKYPTAYLKYRWDLFSEIIGATNHGTYEPTHFNRIDENKFGITFKDRYTTNITLKYIESASNVFWGKPWFVFFLSAVSVLLIYSSQNIRHDFKILAYYSFGAAFMYIAPFFLVTLSGEVRYSFTAIVFSSVSIFVLIFSTNPSSFTLFQKLNNKRVFNQ